MEPAQQKPAALLARSRLFTAAEANALHQRWLAETKGREEPGAFWKWLAARRLITDDQANLLNRAFSEASGAANNTSFVAAAQSGIKVTTPEVPGSQQSSALKPGQPAAKAAIPVGKPVQPPSTSAPRSERPKVRPSAATTAAASEPQAVDSRDVYDVELVAVSPPVGPEIEQDRLALTRRDFVMMALGAGGVLFAAFIGWLLAHLFGRRPESSPTEAAEKAN
ncbi:MAG: hypothetical protein E6K70_04070 [Planctomycetota bacterium]|nr:MAG: hypothetical protein E6K70_04070 [Planctomycetota bacterium]